MVLLAKWILENNPNARVVIVTDRDELDKQIERRLHRGRRGDQAHQQRPRPDEPARPGQAAPALLAGPQVRPQGRGRLRRLHQGAGSASPARRWARCSSSWTNATARRAASCTATMKALMPNAVFIGFTGTPLLEEGQADQPGSLRRLHPHLQVQRGAWRTRWCSIWSTRRGTSTSASARRTRSTPGSRPRPRASTTGRRTSCEKQWGTMQNVLSSRSRMERVVERHRLRLQREAAPVQRARQRHPGGVQHLRGVQVLRRCSRRRRSRASARSSPPTTRRRRT